MTSSQIKTFLIVGGCLSFTETAGLRNLTQSAVSRQMATLEEELDVKLFLRKSNVISLTAAGRRLYEGLRQIDHDLDKLTDEVRQIDNGTAGELRLGLLSDQAVDRVMTAALRRISTEMNIRITIDRMDFRHLYRGLLEGSIDVANSIVQSDRFFLNCHKLLYARERMHLALADELSETIPVPLTEDALSRLSRTIPIYMPRLNEFEDSQQPQLEQLENALWAHQHQFIKMESIVPVTTARLGATLVNESHILSQISGIKLYPADFMASVDKGIIWLDERQNPVIAQFIRVVADVCAQGDIPVKG